MVKRENRMFRDYWKGVESRMMLHTHGPFILLAILFPYICKDITEKEKKNIDDEKKLQNISWRKDYTDEDSSAQRRDSIGSF